MFEGLLRSGSWSGGFDVAAVAGWLLCHIVDGASGKLLLLSEGPEISVA